MSVPIKRPNWPGLYRQKTRHGKIAWYVRVGKGARVRLECEPGTPEFEHEYAGVYALLLKGETPAVKPGPQKRDPALKVTGVTKGTLGWLWEMYRQSSDWLALSKATRRQRENIMSHVLAKAAKMPLDKLSKPMVLAGREERQHTPSQANNFLNTLRHFLSWAVDFSAVTGVQENPCDGVKNVKRPKTKGFPEWTEEDVEKFEAYWPMGSRQRLALAVHLYTGLRRGDAVRLSRHNFKSTGVIHIESAEKNKVELTIPIHPKLAAAIKACPPQGLHILETSRGEGWGSKESYGNTFHEWALQAGVVEKGHGKNSHGIRKTAATRLAELGATEAELMALFGWTDPAMARLYTKAANQKRLAMAAGRKAKGSGKVVGDLFAGAPELPSAHP